MSQSKTTIVIKKDLSEDQVNALKEILNSPSLLKMIKNEYEELLIGMFKDDNAKVESIDFELVD